jgi:hypothetical protein
MKTVKQLPPAPTLEPESNFELSLKAQFIASALSGICASCEQGCWCWTTEHVADIAVEVGTLVYEKFADEHLDVVRKFNRKIGV